MRSAQDTVAVAAFAPPVIVIVGTAVTADIAPAADDQRLHPKNYIHAGHPLENNCNTIHRMVSHNFSIGSFLPMLPLLLLLLLVVVVVVVAVVAQTDDCRG